VAEDTEKMCLIYPGSEIFSKTSVFTKFYTEIAHKKFPWIYSLPIFLKI